MVKHEKSRLDELISTHSKNAQIDSDTVTVLNNFLRSGGRINTDLKSNDKYPNIDGSLELVDNPDVSRTPKQRFEVQIKGTSNYNFNDNGDLKYRLSSLAFLAYVAREVSLNPCILFVVLDATQRGKERVFYLHISTQFLNTIDFNNDSATIIIPKSNEILNRDDSINNFAYKLVGIADEHSFASKLTLTERTEPEIIRMVNCCNEELCKCLEEFAEFAMETTNIVRDHISKKMLSRIEDICKGCLLLNAIKMGNDYPNIRLAYDLARTDIKTKFMASFLQSLRYIDTRVPEDGQSQRLMLKYYNFLWAIRDYLYKNFEMQVLNNLEKFPLDLDSDEQEYNNLIAQVVEQNADTNITLAKSYYYIHSKKAFYIGKDRYFEMTLQLANIHSTKFNRVVVYTKQNISTNYSIKIGYVNKHISILNTKCNIKILLNWQVAIKSNVLRSLQAMLCYPQDRHIQNSKDPEYIALMNILTHTGINLLQLIDLQQDIFEQVINGIYHGFAQSKLKQMFLDLRKYSHSENHVKGENYVKGENTIRYILLGLQETLLNTIVANEKNGKGQSLRNCQLCLNSSVRPFERSPLLFNLPEHKTIYKDVVTALGLNNIRAQMPYIRIKYNIEKTNDIYVDISTLTDDEIKKCNCSLDTWEREQGYKIVKDESKQKLFIKKYQDDVLSVFESLLRLTKLGNAGQEILNRQFLEVNKSKFANDQNGIDDIKCQILKDIFVKSKILLVYGAAGTGKTTLMNYVSNLMRDYKKLFLAYTHTAVENLKQKIDLRQDSDFVSVKSFIGKNSSSSRTNYNVVFIDECSIISNRDICKLLKLFDYDHTLFVMSGDIYQLRAIEFGNWFLYAKSILDKNSIVELNNNWRTKNPKLLELWDETRRIGKLITEKLVIDGPFSQNILDNNVLLDRQPNEVVLCLNYDGKFGLNNLNSIFQQSNPNELIPYKEWGYKVGDPVLFNSSKRFPILHNNLKGTIINIKSNEDEIVFDMKVEKLLTNISIVNNDNLEFINSDDSGSSFIRIRINCKKEKTNQNNNEIDRTIVPFHISYALSIHKSQGLEFDSVKVVIPSSNEESVSHGTFYTAITRAKQNLKVFWSPETMKKVIESFSNESNSDDSIDIIRGLLNL